MRTVVLTSLFPTPGRPCQGIFAKRRWQAMARQNHDVRVIHPLPHTPPAPFDLIMGRERALLSRAPSKELADDFTVYHPRYLHIPRKPVGNAERFGKVAAYCIHNLCPRPDVIICDYAWPAARVLNFLREKMPVVIHGRGSDVTQISRYPFLRKKLQTSLAAAGNWCGVSQNLVQRLDELGNIPNRGMITPNGVDRLLFHSGNQGLARRALNLSPEKPVVLVVGHLIHRKRPLLALESFIQGAPREAQLVFIGRGPLKDNLIKRILEYRLENRVFVIDEMDQQTLAQWYRAASALLITSSREGRPNVVIEALASGLPVVATKTDGSAELMKGFPEFLAPIGNERAIAQCLDLALKNPPTQNTCIEQIAHLTWQKACGDLGNALQSAIDRFN